MARCALLLGASGETGREVLKTLIDNPAFAKVIVVGRKNLDLQNATKVEQRLVDFDNLDVASFHGANLAFCCLGTTRAKAGKEGAAWSDTIQKVDHNYVVSSARLLKSSGCEEFHLVTAKSSDANSMFLYCRTKGRAEEDVKQLGFQRLAIYRPGMLLCDRTDAGFTERLFKVVLKNTFGGAGAISTELLAKVMVNTSLTQDTSGQYCLTLEHSAIKKIAQEL